MIWRDKKVFSIFLAIPVDAIIETIKELKDIDKSSTIIDFGSSKAKISNSIPEEMREPWSYSPSNGQGDRKKFGAQTSKPN